MASFARRFICVLPLAPLAASLAILAVLYSAPSLGSAASPTPKAPVIDVAQPGTTAPPSKLDRSTSFLVININPISGETLTITKTVTNTQTSSSSNTKTPSAVKPNATAEAQAVCTVAAHDPKTCEAAVALLQNAVKREWDEFNDYDSNGLTTYVGQQLEIALTSFPQFTTQAPYYYTNFADATTINDAIKQYQAWIASDPYSVVEAKLNNFYISDRVTTLLQDWNTKYAIYDAVNGILKDPIITVGLGDIKSKLADLTSTKTQATEQMANTLANELSGYKADASPLYQVVNATCENAGFNADSYTINFKTARKNASWEEDVTCFSEFSVGAMYYVDWLSSTTYTLNAKSMPIPQQQNINQGSVAALFNWCPAQGSSAACGTVAASSGTNGLDVFLGGGFLFAHRVLGVNFGYHFGQVNVLTNGYTTASTVPSGATYQRKNLTGAPYVGVTLNLNK